ncbi:MAG: pilus assembly protein [Burkholderiales bacterium]
MIKKNLVYNMLMALCLTPIASVSLAQIPLADQPIFTILPVPGNLALAVSVEFPTVLSSAHPTIGLPDPWIDQNYANTNEYLGYFDPGKCYAYSHSAIETERHFYPIGLATNRTCTSAWSGNFLNWVTMSTIDTFRWALTGGYRRLDTAASDSTPGLTWLEKSWSSNAGDATAQRHPFRRLASSAGISASTPLGTTSGLFRVHALGNKMWVSVNNDLNGDPTSTTPTVYTGGTLGDSNAIYELSVRVKVCDAAIGSLGLTGLEANCVKYGNTYKPEGLMQRYSEKIRYSVFGYLNDHSLTRDGGVLRARQAFIGPIQPVPLSTSVANPVSEWDPLTGVMYDNPRSADATTTTSTFTSGTIVNSGALNYVNKFGQISPTLNYGYKGFDPVGELYYAATRYLKGLPNVSSWTEMSTASTAQKNQFLDGFPVINNWNWSVTDPSPPSASAPTPSDVRDPILYSCQKNFILGIGDVNTHADKNVAGSTIAGGPNEPAAPSFSPDPVDSSGETTRIGTMEDIGGTVNGSSSPSWCCHNNSYLMAGIAYDSNTRDIRVDDATKPQTVGKQTIRTYWVDVLEFGRYRANNQFYLAAKYGGFKVPTGFDPNTTTPLAGDSWYNSTRMSPTPHGGGAQQPMPDNYFVSARADQLVAGLSAAFGAIDADITATTTASATALPQVASSGDTSYSTNYDSTTWSSEVVAAKWDFTANPPTATVPPHWTFSEKLAAQLGTTTTSTGWKTNRRMATWNDVTEKGVPFDYTKLSPGQQTALNTPWRGGSDAQDYLNYLRGARTHEMTSPNYRKRPAISATNPDPNFVGDIIGSKLRVVGRPASLLNDEPGYAAFQASKGPGAMPPTGRRTVVYVGANSGVLHAINGAPYATAPGGTTPAGQPLPEVDTKAGEEMFAYVPSALFKGTSIPSTAATRADNGLVALGNPSYVHRYFVNSTPKQFDVDLANTVKGLSAAPGSCKLTSGPTNWRTVLIGGLGKGGRSYYALDVTDPSAITDEDELAKKVMWEFPRANDPKDPALANKVGFSYGEPVVIRTARFGWVVVLTSGYNSVDGGSYFFLVDVCTGYLVQPPIPTQTGITSVGMAHASAYQTMRESGYADAIYGGDLMGNVWRVDVTPTAADFTSAQRIALLTDGTSSATSWQPITTRIRVEYDPATLDRFVMVGTGRLLDTTDVTSTQKQSFYAFRDGDVNEFDATLPTQNSNQGLLRGDFVNISANLVSGGSFTNQKGWLIDLGTKGDSTGSHPGLGWRMVSDSTALLDTGRVFFFALLPDSSDPCVSGAQSVIYGINFGTGKTVLLQSGGGTTGLKGSTLLGQQVVDLRLIATGSNPASPLACTVNGTCQTVPIQALPVPGLRRLNWREVLLPQ